MDDLRKQNERQEAMPPMPQESMQAMGQDPMPPMSQESMPPIGQNPFEQHLNQQQQDSVIHNSQFHHLPKPNFATQKRPATLEPSDRGMDSLTVSFLKKVCKK